MPRPGSDVEPNQGVAANVVDAGHARVAMVVVDGSAAANPRAGGRGWTFVAPVWRVGFELSVGRGLGSLAAARVALRPRVDRAPWPPITRRYFFLSPEEFVSEISLRYRCPMRPGEKARNLSSPARKNAGTPATTQTIRPGSRSRPRLTAKAAEDRGESSPPIQCPFSRAFSAHSAVFIRAAREKATTADKRTAVFIRVHSRLFPAFFAFASAGARRQRQFGRK